MGINYYAKIIPTEERKKYIVDLIKTSNPSEWSKIREIISETYDSFDEYSHKGGEIHLGKCSYGWKFLWNPHTYRVRNGHTVEEEVEPGHTVYHFVPDPDTIFQIYPLTKEGIKAFIDREDVEIYDEYEEKQDKEEFWNECLNRNKDGLDGLTHEIKDPSHMSFYSDHVKFLISQGYKVEWPYTDFYSDGLRFSTSNDFC